MVDHVMITQAEAAELRKPISGEVAEVRVAVA